MNELTVKCCLIEASHGNFEKRKSAPAKTTMKVLFVFPILIYLLTVNAAVYETEDAIIIEVDPVGKCILPNAFLSLRT